jgi:hypothetical protein
MQVTVRTQVYGAFFSREKSLAAALASSTLPRQDFKSFRKWLGSGSVVISGAGIGSTFGHPLVFGNTLHSILCLRFLTPSKMEAVTVVELDTILTFRKNDFILFIQASKYGLYINQKLEVYSSLTRIIQIFSLRYRSSSLINRSPRKLHAIV